MNTPARTDGIEALRQKRVALESRSLCLRAIRTFFHDRGFLEVDTPVRHRAPLPEWHIDAEPSGDSFLRTSPEPHMKQLLAAGYERIFQLGPCFRRGEYGPLHRPEFTMLEWYRAQAGYEDMLEDTCNLVREIAGCVWGRTTVQWDGHTVDLAGPWSVWTVRDAFIKFAAWDPVAAYDADRFDLDLVDKVEPALARLSVPVVLKDYPVEAAALARTRPGDPHVAERWELYVAGVEWANAYSELTDPLEQRRRFEACRSSREARGQTIYPWPEAFMKALDAGMPPCGGVALGVDRMLLCGLDAASIGEIVPFTE